MKNLTREESLKLREYIYDLVDSGDVTNTKELLKSALYYIPLDALYDFAAGYELLPEDIEEGYAYTERRNRLSEAIDNKPIAVCSLSNNSSVEIYNVTHGIDDEVEYSYCNGPLETATIEYDDNGDAYFEVEDLQIYFKDCIRINEAVSRKSKGYKFTESKRTLTEAPYFELSPRYDARQSFYGKAHVDTGDASDKNRLYSYDTLVAEIIGGEPKVYTDTDYYINNGGYSQTTIRHIREWLKQNGYFADSWKQILRDFGATH